MALSTLKSEYPNLEWCTQHENLAHADRQGRLQKDHWQGKRSVHAKLTDAQVRQVREMYATGGWSWERLGAHFGVGKSVIRNALRKRSDVSTDGWRDISTAPKDGTIVDLWVHGRRVSDAWWGRPSHSCGEYGRHCDSCPSYDGWCDVFGYLTGPEGSEDEEPTHWMPLPSAPLPSSKREG